MIMTFFPVRAKEVAMAEGGREEVINCPFTESKSRESFVNVYAGYQARHKQETPRGQ